MSGGILTNITNSGVDLAGYFSPYEILTITDSKSMAQSNSVTIAYYDYNFTLTKNENNVSNYQVIISLELLSTSANITNFEACEAFKNTPIVYGKTGTGFNVAIELTNELLLNAFPIYYKGFTIGFKIVCLIAYPYSVMQPIINSLPFTQTPQNIINYFTQYLSSTNLRSNLTSQSIFFSLAAKSSLRTDYIPFSTKFSNEPVRNSAVVNGLRGISQILNYIPNRTNTTCELVAGNQNGVSNVYIDTLVLYPLALPSNNYVSQYNTKIGATNFPLSSIFPRCETNEVVVNDENRNITKTFNLAYNTSGTTNYHVIMGLYYNSGGSSSTYNAFAGSAAVRGMFVLSKTASQVTIIFKKTDGEIWNGGLQICIIYP